MWGRRATRILVILVVFLALGVGRGTAQTRGETPGYPEKPYGREELLLPLVNGAASGEDSFTAPLSVTDNGEYYDKAFQSYRDGNWEIYLDPYYGEPLNLSQHNGSDFEPRLSRDGNWVTFASDRHGQGEIFSIKRDRSVYLRLTHSDHDDYAPAWSPDGSQIVFVSHRDSGEDALGEIYRMQADGSAQTRLTYTTSGAGNGSAGNGCPGYSPDGGQIVWAQYSGLYGSIWVMNADGSNPHPVTAGWPYLSHPVWSPDGSWIAFDADLDGDGWNELGRVHPDGSGLEEIFDLNTDFTDVWMGEWNHDGEIIILSRVNYIEYDGQLYLYSLYLLRFEFIFPSGAGTLTNSGLDVYPSWVSLDPYPPVSWVKPLPEYSSAWGVDVQIDGYDVGISGLKVWGPWHVQVREGELGEWFFPSYENGYLVNAHLLYKSLVAEETYFRSSAFDEAGNIELWPEDPDGDAHTKIYTWMLHGGVSDARGYPVPQAELNLSPAAWETTLSANSLARFQAHIRYEGWHSLQAGHSAYGQADIVRQMIDHPVDWQILLPPAENLAQNGGFEAETGGLTGWTAEGEVSLEQTNVFAGEQAGRIGYTCPWPCLTGTLSGTQTTVPIPYIADLSQVVVDSRGQVHVLYRDQLTLYYISRQDETWGDLFEVGSFQSYHESGFPDRDMAVDAGGNLHVVWSGLDGIQYRRRSSVGVWSQPSRLGPGSAVALSPDNTGTLHLIYSCEGAYNTPECTENTHQYRKMPPGGNWGPVKYLGSFDDTPELDLHYDPTGILYILWNDSGTVYFYSWQGGQKSEPEQVFSYEPISAIRLFRDSVGSFHALGVGEGKIWHAIRSTAGIWRFEESVSASEWIGDADFAMGPDDRLYALAHYNYSISYIQQDYRSGWQVITFPDIIHYRGGIAVGPEGSQHIILGGFMEMEYRTHQKADQAAAASLQQQIQLPADMHAPTLDYMLRTEGVEDWEESYVSVSVTDGVTPTLIYSGTAGQDWQHNWADLSAYAGRTVTLTFTTRQAAGEPYLNLLVDNVHLGAWETPVITQVIPAQLEQWSGETITIQGGNFIDPAQVRLGELACSGVTRVDERTLEVALPANLPPGLHTVWVTNPGGQSAALPNSLLTGRPLFLPLVRR